MKLRLPLILLLFFAHQAWAQVRPVCGTVSHLEEQARQNPVVQKQRTDMLRQLQQHVGQLQATAAVKRSVPLTIPVVVHVVYRTAVQNISDAQIQSQLNVLNADFRRLNADAANTPAPFQAVAADTEISFCLAKRDPNGDPTTGITRTQTTVNVFNDNDAMKFTAQGGRNAWPRDQYLNIWVCNLGSALLGYAQFPGIGAASADGVVIGYQYFGTTGTAMAPFNKGRTATHEVGHWLGLEHVWGDSFCGNDSISDTPTQQEATYGCPIFPQISCNNGPHGNMFMNYMDYTDDACMNLFTSGQKNRMHAAIQAFRSSLYSSPGCQPVQILPLDAGIFAISSPQGRACTTTFTPVVVLKNMGSTTLTSAQVHYQANNGPLQTFSWTGSLASRATQSLTLPVQTIGPGNHTFRAYTSAPNNGTDQDHSNDTLTVAFSTTVQTVGLPLPFTESFEAATFPPAGWELHNPDQYLTWERTTAASSDGAASAFVRNFDYSSTGQIDELELPALDLTSVPAPGLSFDLAYTLFTQTTGSDTLDILASTDCGRTFQRVYRKYHLALTTTASGSSTRNFVPLASEWRTETVDLAQLAGQNSVILKFRHATGYQNNLYIDNVKVQGLTGLNASPLSAGISIYPNPTQGQLTVQLQGGVTATAIEIYDALGKRVLRQAVEGEQRLQFDLTHVSPGLYFVRVSTRSGASITKVFLQ